MAAGKRYFVLEEISGCVKKWWLEGDVRQREEAWWQGGVLMAKERYKATRNCGD